MGARLLAPGLFRSQHIVSKSVIRVFGAVRARRGGVFESGFQHRFQLSVWIADAAKKFPARHPNPMSSVVMDAVIAVLKKEKE
jgi:hypothetical protein